MCLSAAPAENQLLPPCGEETDLQRARLDVRLPPAGLLDELAEELVLQLRVGQTHLQGTLGQRHVVIDGRGVDGHVDEQLTSLRRNRRSASLRSAEINFPWIP